MKPLISILLPYKNTVLYLDSCLQSIIDQTYTNWELIAIEDHATDGSLALVQSWATKDARIKTYPNNGKGIIAALRTAYKISTGTHITRMDSDDLMMPTRLAHMIQSLQKHGKGHLAVGQVQYFSKDGIGNGYLRYQNWLNKLTASGTNFEELYKECVIPSPCWMVHRTDLDSAGAFNENRYPEDYDLAFRFYENGLQVIPCNEILLKWRDYSTRTSRTSEHYAQNYFLEIKVHYFLKLEQQPEKQIAIWGAGTKGKTIAKLLLEQNISFNWYCNNPKKIGKDIYGVLLKSFTELARHQNTQLIVTVANEQEQQQVRAYLKQIEDENLVDSFFFC